MGLKARFLATAVFLSFFWGFAEATVFFIVPDVLISLVAVLSGSLFLRAALAALAGALVGGAAVYLVASHSPAVVSAIMRSVPFVTELMIAKVRNQYADMGNWAMFYGSVSGTPYKLYAFAAPAYAGLAVFLAVSIPARLLRFLVVGGVAALAAYLLRRYLSCSDRMLTVIHAAAWIVFYIFYWATILKA